MGIITLAAGCFWGVEAKFRQVAGVVSTRVGYSNGTTVDPDYKQVCTGTTDHAEVIEVTFDDNVISLADILDVFWKLHDPTTLNRQGPDRGTQYRSAIFYHSEQQKLEAETSKQNFEKSGYYPAPIVTEITPADTFYPAEEYHQCYLEKQGKGSCH